MAYETKEQEQPKASSGNTRLPFGLCKRFGIDLPDGATPRDAWDALAGKGISREKVYEALKKKGTVKGAKAESKEKNKKDEYSFTEIDAKNVAGSELYSDEPNRYDDIRKDEELKHNNPLQDKSKYKEQHDEIVNFVKKQVGVDLNELRDGDGSDPFTTAYWDKSGEKVAINSKALSHEQQDKLNMLIAKGKIKQETGGAWIDYISFGKNK